MVLLAALALLAPSAWAGKVFGPSLVWMNFAGDAAADRALHDCTHAKAFCDVQPPVLRKP